MGYQSKKTEIINGELFRRTDENNFTKFNLVKDKVFFRDMLFKNLFGKKVSGARMCLQC